MSLSSIKPVYLIVGGVAAGCVLYNLLGRLYCATFSSTDLVLCYADEINQKATYIKDNLEKYRSSEEAGSRQDSRRAKNKKFAVFLEKIEKSLKETLDTVVCIKVAEKKGRRLGNREKSPAYSRDQDLLNSHSSDDEYLSANEKADSDLGSQEMINGWVEINDDYHTDRDRRDWEKLRKVNRDNLYYLQCSSYFASNDIPCRVNRSEMLECSSVVDYKIKLHAIRHALDYSLKDHSLVEWYAAILKEILVLMIKMDDSSSEEFERAFDDLLSYCRDARNRENIDVELRRRGLTSITFYDIVIDFCILDALDELDSPPSFVKYILGISFVSYAWKREKLAGQIASNFASRKAKYSPDSFNYKFLTLTQPISLVFVCGLFCSSGKLHNFCVDFVDQFKIFIKEAFSTTKSDYTSLESLSKSLVNNVRERFTKFHQNLKNASVQI